MNCSVGIEGLPVGINVCSRLKLRVLAAVAEDVTIQQRCLRGGGRPREIAEADSLREPIVRYDA
ncbi:hypothetical protein N9B24_00045 [bacterium]|nr:hypothetical protein [bacterium]